ncbi:MAG: hypothetical protein HIU84_09910 [Acidobacteria bacterium]|nr:hypothetical protein [Acidobacteriota bacterium]
MLTEDLQHQTDLQLEYLGQLIPAMQEKGAKDPWGLIVITIRRGGEWRGVNKGKLSDDELNNLPVLELGRNLVEDLQANELLGLSDVHILKPHELYLLTRISWDVFGIQPFNKLYHELLLQYAAQTVHDISNARVENDNNQLGEREIAEITVENDRLMFDELKARSSNWPREIVSVSKTCLRMDKNFISVIRVDEVPKAIHQHEYLTQLRMRPLGQWTRRCYGGESVSGELETIAILGKQAQAQSWFGLIADKLSVAHPKMEAIQQELANKARLASHYTIAQLSSKYWAVVSSSERLNRKETKALKADLKARGFKSRVVDEPALHIDAFLTAALGAARM